MGNQIQLQTLLENLIGSKNVYFQPPEKVKIQYPAIIYSRGISCVTLFANNNPYHNTMGYTLIVIDKDPNSGILDKVSTLPMCSWQRHYISDNLNHDVYNIYY